MMYLAIRWSLIFNSFYVFLLLVRQILQIDTISMALAFSQLQLLILILLGAKSLRLQLLELIMLASICISLLLSDFGLYSLNNIMVDFLKPILFIMAVASIRSVKIYEIVEDLRVERILNLYALTTIVSVCIGLYYYYFVDLIYPAYSSIYSLMGYFCIVKRSRTRSYGFLIVLLLSGKRAVMLSGLIAHVLFGGLLNNKKHVFIIILTTASLVLMSISIFDLNIIFRNVLKQDLAQLSELSSVIDVLVQVSGGRIDELIDGLNYEFNFENILFGKSLGYTYESFSFDEKEHKNFHFTPASLFVSYGICFTAMFLYYAVNIIFNSKIKLISEKYGNIYAIRMYMISSLFFFLTEYGVFGYINFCIGLGMLAGLKLMRAEMMDPTEH